MNNKAIAVFVVTVDLAVSIALVIALGSHSRDEITLYTHSWILANPEVTGRADYHSALSFCEGNNLINTYYFRCPYRRSIDGSYRIDHGHLYIRIAGMTYNFRFTWLKRHESFLLTNKKGQKLLYLKK
jgi:hypothetical protein